MHSTDSHRIPSSKAARLSEAEIVFGSPVQSCDPHSGASSDTRRVYYMCVLNVCVVCLACMGASCVLCVCGHIECVRQLLVWLLSAGHTEHSVTVEIGSISISVVVSEQR